MRLAQITGQMVKRTQLVCRKYNFIVKKAPIVQTDNQKRFQMDNYPNGTNAVIAVIAYSGYKKYYFRYDMDDGMIINQSSFMRGFGHGSVHKCEVKKDKKK